MPLVWLLVAVTRTAGYLVLVLLFLYLLFRLHKLHRGWKRGCVPLPGPPALPFLGNTLAFYRHRFATLPLFAQWVRRYGNTYRFTVLGDRDIILINDPESIKHVLSTKFRSGVYGKGAYQQEQYRDLIGMGIFNSNPPLWKEQRRCAAALFTAEALKQHVSVFQRHAHTLCEELLRIHRAGSCDPTSSYAQRGVDMQDYFLRFTLDSFAEIGFGYASHSIVSSGPNRFASAFDLVQSRCFKRMDYGVFWPWIAPPDRRFRESIEYMDSVVYDCIDQASRRGRDQLLEQQRDRPDLLTSSLLDMLNSDGSRSAERYDPRALRDTVLNFLIAGRDTTALMLSWFFFLLAQHPEVEERVLEELERELHGGAEEAGETSEARSGPMEGGEAAAAAAAAPAAASAAQSPSSAASSSGASGASPSSSPSSGSSNSSSSSGGAGAGSDLTFDSLKRLSYLHNALQESLRLYPSVPFNGFTALEDDTLPGGYFVPQGTYVTYSAFLLHRRADLYPDPERFDPSRWERAPARPFRFVAFHGGPRECMGREMAFLEAKIAVATLLRSRARGGYGVRLRLHPSARVELKRAIILTARRGVHMRLHFEGEEGPGMQAQSQSHTPTSSDDSFDSDTTASTHASAATTAASNSTPETDTPDNLDAVDAADAAAVPGPVAPASNGRWSDTALAAASK